MAKNYEVTLTINDLIITIGKMYKVTSLMYSMQGTVGRVSRINFEDKSLVLDLSRDFNANEFHIEIDYINNIELVDADSSIE